MEESKQLIRLHEFMQSFVYLLVFLELIVFIYIEAPHWGFFYEVLLRIKALPIYENLINSKLFVLLMIFLTSTGTRSKKNPKFSLTHQVAAPLIMGLFLMFSSIYFYNYSATEVLTYSSWSKLAYQLMSVSGAMLLSTALDNVSKHYKTGLGNDKWNIDGESFMQRQKPAVSKYAVNIPMQFYSKGRVYDGFIGITSAFRGTIVAGVPGSGKSFGLITPILRSMMKDHGFAICLYDFKFPDLAKVAYHQFLSAKAKGGYQGFSFHVLNLDDPEKSCRINPWKKEYVTTLADAAETAEGFVQALKKGDESGGSDQFFTQSAVNFLACCIYFFSKYEGGKYSSFPHVMSFLNRSYEEIFDTLTTNPELSSLLSIFMSSYRLRAFDQLEGQIGTLKIFMSRLASKESYWIFSGDDFELKISDKKHPSILILANDPLTQSTNAACYSMVMNRLTRLINSKGNLPVGLIVDESPTLYIHHVEHLVAQARSNLTAVLLGFQELPMLQQQYGKETAAIITSIAGNVLSGAVRSRETLEWLEKLMGNVKQIGESVSIDRNKTTVSLSEKLEALVPAGKIAALKTGEVVGIIASEQEQKFDGKFNSSTVHCRVNLDLEAIKAEEACYQDLPQYYDFGGDKDAVLMENYLKIHAEIDAVINVFRAPGLHVPPKASMGHL